MRDDTLNVATDPLPAGRRPMTWRWIHRPATDLAVAFCWVPIVVVVRMVEPSRSSLGVVVGAVFILSFLHQPLTLALVYGDNERYRQRRRTFAWSPLIFVVAVLLIMRHNLVLLAIIGGLWNTEHTLMQRYGLTRIYGRKGGDDHATTERALLFSLLGLALVWVAADSTTPGRLRQVSLGDNNRRGVEVLTSFADVARWLVVPVLVVALVIFGRWLWLEWRRGSSANRAKWVYMGATVALVLTMIVDPIAGLMGYVGAHAIEYFVIVHQSMGRRYNDATVASPLGRAVRARPGRLGFLAGYGLLVLGLAAALQWWAPALVFGLVYFTLGGLHIFYDGFIWKLRDNRVAASLAVPSTPSP